jgi:hypothetical protein
MELTMVRHLSRLACPVILLPLAGCGKKPLTFEPGHVEAIDAYQVHVSPQQAPAKVSNSETAKIEALLAVLRTGEPAADHKCVDDMHVILHRKGGSEQKVGGLAGHDAYYYEFRVYHDKGEGYDMFRVEREPFLKAMAALGLDGLVSDRRD